MELVIIPEKKIAGIQQSFSKRFPYLWIEFFYSPHSEGEASTESELINPMLTLGETNLLKKEGILSIDPEMCVHELEEKFQEIFGVAAQVYRKSGTNWLQTSTTDHWSLKQQNDNGWEMSTAVVEENIKLDYTEQS